MVLDHTPIVMEKELKSISPFENCHGVDFRSSLSHGILAGEVNSLDSRIGKPVSKPLGCSVYLQQRDILLKFSEENRTKGGVNCTWLTNSVQKQMCRRTSFINSGKKKLYRGVRQRQCSKWVAEIRLPQNRMRVWLGTYDNPKVAAYVYDRAAYKLRGEYAKLNFPNLRDATELELGDGTRMNALMRSVDAKIQTICQKVKREKANRNVKKSVMRTDLSPSSSTTSSHISSPVLTGALSDSKLLKQTVPENSFWKPERPRPSESVDYSMGITESEPDGCSLDRMPSYDLDLIWEVLAP